MGGSDEGESKSMDRTGGMELDLINVDATAEMQKWLDMLPVVQQPENGLVDVMDTLNGHTNGHGLAGFDGAAFGLNGAAGAGWDFLPLPSSPINSLFAGVGVF